MEPAMSMTETTAYDEWEDWIGTLYPGQRYARVQHFKRGGKGKWVHVWSEYSTYETTAEGREVIDIVDVVDVARMGMMAIHRRWLVDPDGKVFTPVLHKRLQVRPERRLRQSLNAKRFKVAGPADGSGEVVTLAMERERRRRGD